MAKPNYSEHQLGLALDINADKSRCDNDTIYQWLSQNAYRYGFILRYPEGKEDITGIDYEPWHYRYVGKEAAQGNPVGKCLLGGILRKDMTAPANPAKVFLCSPIPTKQLTFPTNCATI